MKNNTQNVLENLFPDPILKDQNGVYLWINNLKIYAVCFDCMLSWGLSKYIETKLQTTCFYLVKKLSFFFFKKKRVWNSSLPNSLFSVWSLKNNISFIFYYLTKFHCVVYLSFVRQLAMGNVFVNQVEIWKIIVLVELLFYMTKKSRKKIYLPNEKRY